MVTSCVLHSFVHFMSGSSGGQQKQLVSGPYRSAGGLYLGGLGGNTLHPFLAVGVSCSLGREFSELLPQLLLCKVGEGGGVAAASLWPRPSLPRRTSQVSLLTELLLTAPARTDEM